jgi:cytochrome oxidase Cu insertion factor (SCO1/SenC/PrrC family)
MRGWYFGPFALALLCLALPQDNGRVQAVEPGSVGSAADRSLNVGEKAPAFTLKDQTGKDRSLATLVKKGKVALVFYRSVRW